MASFNILRVQVVNNKSALQFCRACACEIKKSSCEIENNPTKPELPLLLKRYVPEFDVKVANASLCTDCVSTLYSFHNFKRKCLRTEEDLRLHIRQNPEIETVELSDVFAHVEQGNNNTKTTERAPIKRENTVTNATEGAVKKIPRADLRLRKQPEESGNTVTNTIEAVQGTLSCQICDLTFRTKGSLESHTREYHGRKQYHCDQCNRTFASKALCDVHIEYHKKPYSHHYICKICNFVYQSYTGLNEHNISKHQSDDKKPFGCKFCKKRFVDKYRIDEHMRIHTGEKPFKCQMCHYAGRTKTCIARHSKTCAARHLDMYDYTIAER